VVAGAGVGLTARVPADFQPGLRLAAAFFADVVRPLLASTHPGLSYAAALIGPGSEVLGRDTARSTDHDWGPRLQLFLRPEDHPRLGAAIDELLGRELPETFAGFPTRFALSKDAPVRHRVTITTPNSWYQHRLGFLPHARIELLDWLATPSQVLLEETSGAVFHDEPGVLGAGRAALAWYPDPVWRYLLAAQWQRISQEEAFVGRCAEVGDELGAAVLTARLVRDLGRLHLLMDRRYPPYAKWFGSAVADLAGVAEPLLEALHSTGTVREAALCRAYEQAAARHNELRLTAAVDGSTRWFFDRPYRVLMADRFAAALVATQTDPALRDAPLLGAVDQFADSTDLVGSVEIRRAVTAATLRLPPDE
jgi:Domain of unknown function (DUF4037)